MPKHVRFELTDVDGPRKFETNFLDEEWALLEEYAAAVDELLESPAAIAVASFGFSVRWDRLKGWEPVDASRFPSRTELAAVLHLARPFVLQGERTYFGKVLSIISARAPSKAWKALRAQFDGARFESMMTVAIVPAPTTEEPSPQAFILNSGRTFHLWLNAFEYHRDADKAAQFNEIHADDFPTPNHVKGFMLQLLYDRLGAAEKLREIIRVFQQGPGASFTTAGFKNG